MVDWLREQQKQSGVVYSPPEQDEEEKEKTDKQKKKRKKSQVNAAPTGLIDDKCPKQDPGRFSLR
ncbi:MAG: hypothetical protein H0A75_04900 [Candidatus Methanofishera endochildressiae]|uniref:Uncharacterized protein n=1 Tax=Candidatus Methanofishera endochildressiae TaxID=2738884 RepID=A0A7Z0SDT1_9GAMM|nr:hypothetical protein [Candidatus Methanofishera endochildressiae]